MITPDATIGSATDRAWHEGRSLIPALVLGALLSGCGTTFAASATDELFERHEVVTGEAAQRQTVLTGFFLGGATAELAVVHVDDNDDRRLRMYGLDGGAWVPVLEATLGPEVLFVDVADIGGRDRLITYEAGRLSWFDPISATAHTLVEVAARYRATDDGEIPHVDISRDLNHDGLDDLVVPDVEGFWISTQASDGSFSDAVRLGPPEPFAQEWIGHFDVGEPGGDGPRTFGEVGITAMTIPLYLRRIHEMDYDRDGRTDLVFWKRDHFELHRQDERRRFAPVAETFTTEVPFDGEGAYSRGFEYRDSGIASLLLGIGKKTRRTVLHSVRDLNADGVADLVTLTLAGRSITRQRSRYDVHFGAATPEGVVFAREVGATIRPRGKGGGLEPWGYSSRLFRDLDGDGRVDIMLRDVDIGLGGMFRALVGNSVGIDLEFYCGEDGAYPDGPTARRRIRRFAPFAGLGNVFFPPVLMGDVDGDGRSDLVVGHSPRELRIFLGVPGPGLLARRPRKMEIALPPDERYTRLVDLNRDGKQDLLVHLKPTERAPERPHRLTTLIAR
jgi:hypothetical protein